MDKLRIVVGGFIGLYPTGGVTWDYLQYPLGLKLLGHDVYYIEDTVQFPKYQKNGRGWNDATDSIEYLKNVMEQFGFKDRWAYRDVASGNCYGLSLKKVKEICKTADVFINISASTFLRDEYLAIPKRVLIDSDPMFTQIEYFHQTQNNIEGNAHRMDFLVNNHNYLFSFGENIGKEDCKIPTFGLNWRTTRQPICLDCWPNNKPALSNNRLTTVMNWSVSSRLVYDNTTWGQKDVEFEKFQNIPVLFPELNFAIMASNIPLGKQHTIVAAGWETLDPLTGVTDANKYKAFIESSAAEFSVAKETYVKSNSGWFSCRSACYLAAGKPVITQDTQWSSYIPSGQGLFAFQDQLSAIAALREMEANYAFHSKMAREIANEYFDSNKVLTALLNQVSQAVPHNTKHQPQPVNLLV